MKRLLLSLLVAVGSVAVLVGAGRTQPPELRISLAVLPCTNIELTFRKFNPLLQYLKETAGLTVKLVVPGDIDEAEAKLKNGQVDIVLQDPHTFSLLLPLFDPATLLQAIALDGSTSQTGVVVVRRDSGISNLAQLRGRAVMFGPRASTSKWVAARMLFEDRGLNPDLDVKSIKGGCCEDIAFAVTIHSVDAGLVCEHFMGQQEARLAELGADANALRVIAHTPPFPTRILAARLGARPEKFERLARALLAMSMANPREARVLRSAEVLGFRPTTEAKYLGALRAARLP